MPTRSGRSTGNPRARRSPPVTMSNSIASIGHATRPVACDNAAMPTETFACELKHGIMLTIESPSSATLRGVANFLAQAMAHFKEHRDVRKTQAYTHGSYSLPIEKRRGKAAIGTLSHPGDGDGSYLTAALWTDAVIKGYVNADTVLQMIEQLPAYKSAATPGDWMCDVLAMLDKPRGEFQAFAFMVRRDAQK